MKLRQRLSPWYPLFLISSLSLFLELTVIRWVSGEVRLLSYFKNIPLLAAFLGLAIGFAIAGKGRDYRTAFAPLLGMFVVLVLAIGRVSSPQALAYPGAGDEWLWFSAPISDWIALITFHGILLITFLFIMLLFIPIGQSVGEEMALLMALPAYLVNILASLIGVWAFTLVSFLETPPVIWFGLSLLGIGVYFARKGTFSRATWSFLVVVLAGLAIANQDTVWSPYQRLDVSELNLARESDGELVKVGYILGVQRVFYQRAIDLSSEFLDSLQNEIPVMDEIAFSYNLPYRLVPRGSRALVVGAGMGNDVAAALRSDVRDVDAVEIDPTIVEFGRELHPERPYDDQRVNLIVNDARSFFNEQSARYDVIVFGLLDSQTLLSSLSSVRLDSFVYTVESFEQVKEHLDEGGIVSVTFAQSAPWIAERIGLILSEVFGAGRVYVHRGYIGNTFVAGDVSPEKLTAVGLTVWEPDPSMGHVPLSTDDWPYLYLRTRKIPSAYWHAIILIGVVCLAMIARSFPEALRPNWHFWLLGAAFLLIEFKGITELALLFGTTWLVNALAISGVLVMILAANLYVLWRPELNLRLVYGLLLVSLVMIYFLPLGHLAGLAPLARGIASTTILSTPLFFAGLIFAESLRRAGETSKPLASNLSGATMGGLLEYSSLQWGIKSLYPIAFVLYLGAMIASRFQLKSPG